MVLAGFTGKLTDLGQFQVLRIMAAFGIRGGSMLPCNVILRAVADGVEVSVTDSVASMSAIEDEKLKAVAGEVREMLRAVVASI